MKVPFGEDWQDMAILVVGLSVAFAFGVHAAQEPAKPPDPQQLQQTIATLVQALNEARETSQAQAAALVAKTQTIQALQAGIGPACVASVERANPGKTLDEKFAIKDKPKEAGK